MLRPLSMQNHSAVLALPWFSRVYLMIYFYGSPMTYIPCPPRPLPTDRLLPHNFAFPPSLHLAQRTTSGTFPWRRLSRTRGSTPRSSTVTWSRTFGDSGWIEGSSSPDGGQGRHLGPISPFSLGGGSDGVCAVFVGVVQVLGSMWLGTEQGLLL